MKSLLLALALILALIAGSYLALALGAWFTLR